MRTAMIAVLLIIAPAPATAGGCSDWESAANDRVGQLLQTLMPEQQVIRISNSGVVDTIGIGQTCYFVAKGSVRFRQRNGLDKNEVFTMRIQYDASIGKWTGSNLMLFVEF